MIIYTDGASRGNPGPASIGAVLEDGQGKVVKTISQSIGRATNNQAEYRAVIVALENAIELGVSEVEIRSDSELVVRQVNGIYRVKEASLKLLYQQVKKLQGKFSNFSIIYIPREQNKGADRLAGQAFE